MHAPGVDATVIRTSSMDMVLIMGNYNSADRYLAAVCY